MEFVPEVVLLLFLVFISALTSISSVFGILFFSLFVTYEKFFSFFSLDWSILLLVTFSFLTFILFRFRLLVLNVFSLFSSCTTVVAGFFLGRMFHQIFINNYGHFIKIFIGIKLFLVSEYLRRNFILLNLGEKQLLDSEISFSFFNFIFMFIVSVLSGVFGIDLMVLLYIYFLLKFSVIFELYDLLIAMIFFCMSIAFSAQSLVVADSVPLTFLTPKVFLTIFFSSLFCYKFYRSISMKLRARIILYVTYIFAFKNLFWGIRSYF